MTTRPCPRETPPRAEPATGATYSRALHDAVFEIREHLVTVERVLMNSNIIWDGPEKWRACIPPLPDSGPGSASATKESSDTAGAPAGAANAADRDCNCDQAVELARVVKECRRLALEIVVATETTPG